MGIEVVGMDRVLARLDPARWAAGVRTGLQRSGDEMAEAARGNLGERSYTGRAAANVQSSVEGTGIALELRVGVNTAIAPEAAVLESGRRPGAPMPPPDVIASWLASSGGDAASAFVVARAIGRRGMSPTHWLSRAVATTRPAIAGNVRTGIDEALG